MWERRSLTLWRNAAANTLRITVELPIEEGELIADAQVDTIFLGYLNRPDATAEKIRDGWYFTGDVVRREPGGMWTLMGRVDDMIRSGGENIHPEEIEEALKTHHEFQLFARQAAASRLEPGGLRNWT